MKKDLKVQKWIKGKNNPGRVKRIFFFSKNVQTGAGAHQASYIMDTGVLFRG
jgi:hypothetical protein